MAQRNQPRTRPAKRGQGGTVSLEPHEDEEAVRRAGLRAEVVFESVRREGENELQRSPIGLAFSGLAAGLSMGLSLIATGVIRAALPDVAWRPLLENFGYTLGFLVVILGRQQLFTEDTVTAIIPLLDDGRPWQKVLPVARLWGIVLVMNLIGSFLLALALVHSDAFAPAIKQAFTAIGVQTLSYGFWTVMVKGVFAGWLIALMVWLLPAAKGSRVSVIIIVTYIVGLGGLSHVIAGSVDAFYALIAGASSWQHVVFGFLLPVFIGNSVGGVLLVSLLNYGQVAVQE
jgi:formate/nitrite transporter FocA (FNT family)